MVNTQFNYVYAFNNWANIAFSFYAIFIIYFDFSIISFNLKLIFYISYYAFELCAGSMDQLFLPENNSRKYKGPPLRRQTKVLLQLAEGLAYIHSNRLVHRDIKPANVLISITDPVSLKWADFGLIKETSDGGTMK